MAKQTGPIIWEKTFGIISFYKRCGRGYVRMKSNLTGERWRSDPAFEGSRKSADCMALAAPLASTFYQTIPKHQRIYPHYKQLVGIAQHMLFAGYAIEQVNKVLHYTISRYLMKLQAADPNRKPLRSPFAATLSLKAKPAFTSAIPHQMAAPQFTASTVSKPTLRQWWIIPPRGSPAVSTGCICKNRNPYQPQPALGILRQTPAVHHGRAYYALTRPNSCSVKEISPQTVEKMLNSAFLTPTDRSRSPKSSPCTTTKDYALYTNLRYTIKLL